MQSEGNASAFYTDFGCTADCTFFLHQLAHESAFGCLSRWVHVSCNLALWLPAQSKAVDQHEIRAPNCYKTLTKNKIHITWCSHNETQFGDQNLQHHDIGPSLQTPSHIMSQHKITYLRRESGMLEDVLSLHSLRNPPSIAT